MDRTGDGASDNDFVRCGHETQSPLLLFPDADVAGPEPGKQGLRRESAVPNIGHAREAGMIRSSPYIYLFDITKYN
jgi:hypothetical protein